MSLHGNVQKFCDDSTMHGFKELYYSRNCFWKLFWGIVLVGAAAITAYQVYDAAIMYWEQPTVTIVYPLQDDIQKPNIDFCFDVMYVLSWMTFNSTIINKSTEKYFLHLLSKMTNLPGLEIFYSKSTYFKSFYDTWKHNFNITKSMLDASKEDYEKFLHDKGIKNELFFAKQFISETPRLLFKTNEMPLKVTYLGTYICYSYSLNNADSSQFLFSHINSFGSIDMLGPMTRTMLQYTYPELFANSSIQNNAPFFSYQAQLMIGIGNLQPLLLYDLSLNAYIIQINIKKLISINRQSKPCSSEDDIRSNVLMEIPKDKHLSCNYTCYNLCMYKKQNGSHCVTMEQIVVGLQNSEDVNVRLCEWYEDNNELDGWGESSVDSPWIGTEIDKECELKCPISCTQWVYFASIESDRANQGVVYPMPSFEINFPLSFSVLVSEELVAYTWTTLIGNIGGLLGLWLGASLLSFIQSIYLIFCYSKDPVEDVSSNVVMKVPKVKNKVGVIDVE